MEFNPLIPELDVSNFKKSLDFYTKTIGFQVEYSRIEDKFAFLTLHGAQLMIEENNSRWRVGKLKYPFGRGINFEIAVPNAKKLYSKIQGKRYPIKFGLEDKWYRKNKTFVGNRQFLVMDPDGYLLRFAEPLGEVHELKKKHPSDKKVSKSKNGLASKGRKAAV
jgi:catechol 2,3-dioxygenase-like lactoylglutathione lyase family enzyme